MLASKLKCFIQSYINQWENKEHIKFSAEKLFLKNGKQDQPGLLNPDALDPTTGKHELIKNSINHSVLFNKLVS